jgi:hypothetical protein
MPNPNGTHTKDEHRQAIIALAQRHIENGMTPENAFTVAGAEWRDAIKQHGEQKMDEVLRWLNKSRSGA